MTPKLVFSVAAAVTGVLGLAYLAAPDLMLGSLGVSPEQATVFMTRRYGAALVGYSAILWFARAAAASPARHAIGTGGWSDGAARGSQPRRRAGRDGGPGSVAVGRVRGVARRRLRIPPGYGDA